MKSLPINMLLKKLINNIPEKKNNIFIRGLSTNSKDVKSGYIFFAIKGNNKNGEKFIKEAIVKGASVIVCSKSINYKKKINNKKTIILKKKTLGVF